ncbi:MAG: NUDIX domain-containing protein [Planctomycetaceae bacterium]|nr:NUDIX domain-containing protein [Planctomycetaceae bacterium]
MTQIGIAIVEHEKSFLVGLRSDHGPLAGYHEFPGGKQNPGEALSQTATRECLEETGVVVTAVRLMHRKSFQYDHDDLHLEFWLCKPNSCPDSQGLITPWQWITRDQLHTLNFPPANEDLLQKLMSLEISAIDSSSDSTD